MRVRCKYELFTIMMLFHPKVSFQINVTVTPPTPQPRKTSPATPTKSLHANLTPTLSPTSSFQKSALAPLLTPLDLDAMTMDLQNLETIKVYNTISYCFRFI